MERIFKRVAVAIKAVDEASRRVRLIITTDQVDRDGDVVLPAGAIVAPYLANPVVLFGHMSLFPVGNATELVVRENEIEAEVEFFTEEESPLAERLFKLYSRGKLRAASIGFLPTPDGISTDRVRDGQTGRTFKQWELLEFSLVAIPSNRGALSVERQAAMAKGLAALMPDELKDPELALGEMVGDPEPPAKPASDGAAARRTVLAYGVQTDLAKGLWLIEASAAFVRSMLGDPALDVQFKEDARVLAKAGRVIAARNMERLRNAKALLDEVIAEEETRRAEPEEDAALSELTKMAADLVAAL